MKTSKAKRIIFALLLATVLITLTVGISVTANSSSDEERTLEIVSNNISSRSDISIMYAVKATGFTDSEQISFSVWDSDPRVADGNGAYPTPIVTSKPASDTTTIKIDGVSYDFIIFTTPGIPSKNLCDSYYVEVSCGEVTSGLYRYSILEYLFERIYTCQNTAEQLEFYEQLMGYGEYSQILFGYNTDALPSDYRYVSIVDGTIDGENSVGIYKLGDTLTLKYTKTVPAEYDFVWELYGTDCNITTVKDGTQITVTDTVIIKPSFVGKKPTVDFESGVANPAITVPSGLNVTYVNVGTEEAPNYAFSATEPTANKEMKIHSDMICEYEQKPFGKYVFSVDLKYDFTPNGTTGKTQVGAIIPHGGAGYAGLLYVYINYDGENYTLSIESTADTVTVGGIKYAASTAKFQLTNVPFKNNEWFNLTLVIDRAESYITSVTESSGSYTARGSNATLFSLYINDMDGNNIAKNENFNYYHNLYHMGMTSEPLDIVWRCSYNSAASTYTMYMDNVSLYGEEVDAEALNFDDVDTDSGFTFPVDGALSSNSQTDNLSYINAGTSSEPDYKLHIEKPAAQRHFWLIPSKLNGQSAKEYGRYTLSTDIKINYTPTDPDVSESNTIAAFIFGAGSSGDYAFHINVKLIYTAPSIPTADGGIGKYQLQFSNFNGSKVVDGITYPAGATTTTSAATVENNEWLHLTLAVHREETLIQTQTATAITGVNPSYYTVYIDDSEGNNIFTSERNSHAHNLYRTGIMGKELWLGWRSNAAGNYTLDVDNLSYYGEMASSKETKHASVVQVYNYDATATDDGTYSEYCTLCDVCVKEHAGTVPGTSSAVSSAFAGLNVSVLGDSISSFANVSGGTAAETTNSTIEANGSYYFGAHNTTLGITQADTWWQQTIDMLGASLLVNNSWSGSYIRRTNGNATGAYLDRCLNLHDNTGDNAGTEPDIIFVYLGTNDICADYADFGDPYAIDYDNLSSIVNADSSEISTAEAYAVMLYKIMTEYENAEIYCLNVLESNYHTEAMAQALPGFNGMIKEIAQRMGVHYVDIYNETGIRRDDASYDTYIPAYDGDDTVNYFHPGNEGMDLITECVLRAVLKNSKYAGN